MAKSLSEEYVKHHRLVSCTCLNCGTIYVSFRSLWYDHYNKGSGQTCYQKIISGIKALNLDMLDQTDSIRLELLRDIIDSDLKRVLVTRERKTKKPNYDYVK